MKTITKIILAVLLLSVQIPLFSQNRESRPLIQLALLLDTSNSMDGLINQAKSQLWRIVSETGRARKRGQEPVLEVALYEYGNDNLSPYTGYIRQILPFTTDLDDISSHLFQLSTFGGSEYCGQVISEANRRLDWDRNPDTLKLIFIAGNEPFDQGPEDYIRSCSTSNKKAIIINTIFCGDYREGISTNWQHGAHLTGGRYININSDYEAVYIPSPQDDRIEELNRRLNNTYLGYGSRGAIKKEMQEEQDNNASEINLGSLLERAKVKSSASYSNSSWDIVDAYTEGEIDLAKVPETELPDEMKGLSGREKEEYIRKLEKERKEIQSEISKLSTERDQYIREQTEMQKEESTLDKAVIETVQEAVRAKGFSLE